MSLQPMNTRWQIKMAPDSKLPVAIVLGCVVLAQFGIMSWGAENPARFLAVESWQGDFRHDVSGTYSQEGVNCTQVYTIGQSLFASGIVLSNSFELDGLRYWESNSGVTPVQGSVHDKAEGSCIPGVVTTIDLDSVYGSFRVVIDTNANQYVVEFGLINLNLVAVDSNGTHREKLAVMWGPSTTNTLPASGLTLSGSTTVTLDLTTNSIAKGIFAPIWAYFSGQMHLVASWTFTPYKAVDLKITSVQTPVLTNGLHTFVSTDDLTLRAQARPPVSGQSVKWTVVGRDAATGITGFPADQERQTDGQGISTFTLRPANNATFASVRHTAYTNGSLVPNAPISFEVTAELESGERIISRLSETTLGLLKQDETDILRQEYWDFRIPVPSRQDVVSSLGGHFNRSPYDVQLSVDLQSHYDAILNAYRGSTITVGGQPMTIPPTADMQITVGGGFRSPRKNRAAGSKYPDSNHTRGRALDLKPIVFPVVVNGNRTQVDLHGTLYPALAAAIRSQGLSVIAEKGATDLTPGSERDLQPPGQGVGDAREDHLHVQW